MKRVLEVLLVAAALGLAGFMALHLLSRSAPPSALAPRPGPDVADRAATQRARPVPSIVTSLPMIQLAAPPHRRPRAVDVPPAP